MGMVIRDEFGTLIRILPDENRFVRYLDSRYRMEWSDCLRADPCTYCGKDGGTVDHVEPKATGGEVSTITNGVGCCTECNNRKGDIDLLSFLSGKRATYKRRLTKKQIIERNTLNRGFFSSEQIEMMKEVVHDD